MREREKEAKIFVLFPFNAEGIFKNLVNESWYLVCDCLSTKVTLKWALN